MGEETSSLVPPCPAPPWRGPFRALLGSHFPRQSLWGPSLCTHLPPGTFGGAGSSQLLLPGDNQSLGDHSAPWPSLSLLPPSLGTPGVVPLGAPLQTQSSWRGEGQLLTPRQLPGFYVPWVLQPPLPKQAAPPAPQLGYRGGSSKILSQREVRLVLQDPALGSHPDPHPRWARPPSCFLP